MDCDDRDNSGAMWEKCLMIQYVWSVKKNEPRRVTPGLYVRLYGNRKKRLGEKGDEFKLRHVYWRF